MKDLFQNTFFIVIKHVLLLLILIIEQLLLIRNIEILCKLQTWKFYSFFFICTYINFKNASLLLPFTDGNTVDVLKGCIPKLQVDSVCHGLRAVERARGHSNARCYICNHNDCNSSIKEKLSFVALLMTMILYFVLR